MRHLVIALFLVCASAGGQVRLPGPPPLTLPPWLSPFPEARDKSAKATASEANFAYTALALPVAVVSHYEHQMRDAGIAFETTDDGMTTRIQALAENLTATVRIREDAGGVNVEVNCAPRPDAPADTDYSLLRLEWPSWLAAPGARVLSDRTNPPGRIGKALAETCPGDVAGQPSQGCLDRVYQAPDDLQDLREYFHDLLARHGYVSPTTGADVAGHLVMRQYPEPRNTGCYRQVIVSLRAVQAIGARPAGTKVELSFLISPPPPVQGRLAGTWTFTHFNGRFEGTIVVHQSGSDLTGTWHTSKGKVEPDDTIAGRIDGDRVAFTRYIVGDVTQTYVMTLSADGSRLDGFGEGFFLNHTNLNMFRVAR